MVEIITRRMELNMYYFYTLEEALKYLLLNGFEKDAILRIMGYNIQSIASFFFSLPPYESFNPLCLING